MKFIIPINLFFENNSPQVINRKSASRHWVLRDFKYM